MKHLASELCLTLTLTVALTFPLQTTHALAEKLPAQSIDLSRMATTSVVVITGEDAKGQPISPGADFFIGAHTIATDYRLVKDAVEIHVSLAGQQADKATLVGVDSKWTVAVMTVSGIEGTPLVRGVSQQVKRGNDVFAFGNQSGSVGLELRTTVSDIVAADDMPYFKLSTQEPELIIGGPIFNEAGQVIGIASARNDRSGFSHAVSASALDEFGYSPTERTGFVRYSSRDTSGEVPGGVPLETSSGKLKSPGDASPVVRKAGGVLQGSAIRRAQPLFPPLAKAARVSGSVVIEVTVNKEGDVVSARAVSGHPLLKDSAVAAARGWKFSPTNLDGTPIAVIGTITFNFSM